MACEESQAVCIEMRRLGHQAFSCDLMECSGGRPEWHIMGDCLPLLNGGCSFRTMDGVSHEQQGEWDMIIAFPPCTFLTSAGSMNLVRIDANGERWIKESRFLKMKAAVEFFNYCLNAKAPRICVENPAPMKICGLPRYDQIVEPYMFGHPYKKRTCLWLKGLPRLKESARVEPRYLWVNSGGGKTDRSILKFDRPRNSRERSKTFPGIARAMAEQWAGECEVAEK